MTIRIKIVIIIVPIIKIILLMAIAMVVLIIGGFEAPARGSGCARWQGHLNRVSVDVNVVRVGVTSAFDFYGILKGGGSKRGI